MTDYIVFTKLATSYNIHGFKYEGYSVGVCFILFLTVANVCNYDQEISAYQEIADVRCMAHLNTFCLNCQVSLAKKKIKFMKYLTCSGKCILLYCIYRESIQFLLIGRHIVALLFLFQQVQNINTFNIQKALPKKWNKYLTRELSKNMN